MLKVKILGTGRALPATKRTTGELENHLGLKTGSLLSACGVESRYCCDQESQIDLAVGACRIALASAGLEADDIDLVLSGSSVAFQPIPSMAPLVMRQLGVRDGDATAYDVNSTCLSFVTALESAARLVEAGVHKRAIVFSSEIASRALPWEDAPDVAALFGDGAAAAVIGPASGDQESGIVASRMNCYPSAYEACELAAGGTRFDYHQDRDAFDRHASFKMDGKELFRITKRHFRQFVDSLLAEAGWTHDDVDVVVPHQASPLALEHMIRQSGFSRDQVVNIAAEFGNQIAASIPFTLDLAVKNGQIQRGNRILLLGTSAGISLGGSAIVF